jgi:hypothetical protein
MNADSNAPKLAKRSVRPDETSSSVGREFVAHGDLTLVDPQQSATGVGAGTVSSNILQPILSIPL